MVKAYVIDYSMAAARDFVRLRRKNPVRAARVKRAVDALASDPRPEGVKSLAGSCYRIRSGDYRIVYDVIDERVLVLVLRIGHRSKVYRGLR